AGTRTSERGHVSERADDRHNFPEVVVSAPRDDHDFPEVVTIMADGSSWRRVLRRAGAALLPRRRDDRRRGWSLLVPVVLLLAGMLFTPTATTANGTDLRNDRRPELANLITERKHDVAAAETRAADLRHQIEAETGAEAGSDARVAEQRSRGQSSRAPAGL